MEGIKFEISKEFQTPPVVCDYMVGLVPPRLNILEPTPGEGNLVTALANKGHVVSYPAGDFWEYYARHKNDRYDAIVMNPPFTPMVKAYEFLEAALTLSDNVVALMPWLCVINSDRRLKWLQESGLASITHLPRKTFPRSRIQTCILHIKKGYMLDTTFEYFNW